MATSSADGSGPPERWEGCTAEELAAAWRLPAVRLYHSIGSTNDAAQALGQAGARTGTVVIADEQRSGRGRSGRSWSSPPGLGLWCSLLSRPADATELPRLPLRVGAAVAEALAGYADLEPVRLKWPNDILLGGRKMGGILCEAAWDGPRVQQVVIGIGLNLLHGPGDFPPALAAIATSLRLASGAPVSRYDVATAVIDRLRPLLHEDGSMPDFPTSVIARHDALRGLRVEVSEPESGRLLHSGIAAGIEEDGALCLMTAGGIERVRSGTVRLAGGRG